MKKETRRGFLKKGTLAGLGLVMFDLPAKGEVEEPCPVPADGRHLTTQDYYGQGPFYTENAPDLTNGILAEEEENGDRIIISGYVLDLETGEPLPDTEIDMWHANNAGEYDNSGYNLRGKVYSDETGYYSFETVKPGLYLNGTTYRPSHLHFKITPPNEPVLITQAYFEGDEYISSDRAASVDKGEFDATDRIISLSKKSEGVFEGCWNIVFDSETSITALSHNLDKGALYSVSVNATNALRLHIGVFEGANLEIQLFSMQGRQLDKIPQSSFNKGKHFLEVDQTRIYTSGMYLVQLIIDGEKTIPQKFYIH